MKKVALKRSVGLEALELLRRRAADGDSFAAAWLSNHDVPELTKCDGEAHSNGYIDNCDICAPRWGYVGPFLTLK